MPHTDISQAGLAANAVALLLNRAMDIIVLDLSLPDASGFEAPARLLSIAGKAKILVLSLTAELVVAAQLMQRASSPSCPRTVLREIWSVPCCA